MTAKRDPSARLVEVRMTPELRAQIDDFRFERRIASRGEAMRRLVEMGLEIAKAAADKRRS